MSHQDKTGRTYVHITKQKKSIWKGNILYDSNYVTF